MTLFFEMTLFGVFTKGEDLTQMPTTPGKLGKSFPGNGEQFRLSAFGGFIFHSEMALTESRYDASELPDLLPVYYRRLFPYPQYFRWLSYGGGKAKILK